MFQLDEEQKMILETVRRIATREVGPRAAELDETAGFPQHAVDVFAQNGLLTPLLPAEHGGVQLSLLLFSMVLEEIAKVCSSSALILIAQADGMLPILHSGGTELKQRYLDRLSG